MNSNKTPLNQGIIVGILSFAVSWSVGLVAAPAEDYPQSQITYQEVLSGDLPVDRLTCYQGGSHLGDYNSAVVNTRGLQTQQGVVFPETMQLIYVDCSKLENLVQSQGGGPLSFSASVSIRDYVEMSVVNGQELCSKYFDRKTYLLSIFDPRTSEHYTFEPLANVASGRLAGVRTVDVAAGEFCNLNLFR
jgi:hypothetical protein